jgi:hypothetical protein
VLGLIFICKIFQSFAKGFSSFNPSEVRALLGDGREAFLLRRRVHFVVVPGKSKLRRFSMKRFRIGFAFLSLMLVAGLQTLHGEEWDKATKITFSESVQVPGTVFPGHVCFQIA